MKLKIECAKNKCLTTICPTIAWINPAREHYKNAYLTVTLPFDPHLVHDQLSFNTFLTPACKRCVIQQYLIYLCIDIKETCPISDFIWPFLPPYMGLIPNPKMAFIFPISCILVLIFPIFMTWYFPKCEGKDSFPKSQIKSLPIDVTFLIVEQFCVVCLFFVGCMFCLKNKKIIFQIVVTSTHS